VQVCYECGAERPARELHTEELPAGFAARPVKIERPLRHRTDQHVAIGQTVLSHLTLVK
jgi:hypothetical protein